MLIVLNRLWRRGQRLGLAHSVLHEGKANKDRSQQMCHSAKGVNGLIAIPLKMKQKKRKQKVKSESYLSSI